MDADVVTLDVLHSPVEVLAVDPEPEMHMRHAACLWAHRAIGLEQEKTVMGAGRSQVHIMVGASDNIHIEHVRVKLRGPIHIRYVDGDVAEPFCPDLFPGNRGVHA
jgi:hypothetical protein